MEYALLERTDLRISRIGLGCEPLGGADWGTVDPQEAARAVARSLELGVNLFDTADVYGLGRSEERLAAALGRHRRDVVIVTKGGVGWRTSVGGRAETFRDSSPGRMVEALEGSLRRLALDCIPLYLVHWPDGRTPVGETVAALERQRCLGKIRHIGVSNFSEEQLREAVAAGSIAALELEYSLLSPPHARKTVEVASELGIGVLAYGTLAQGLLTGKFGMGVRFAANDRRHRLERFSVASLARSAMALDGVKGVAASVGKTPAQVAVRWVLAQPGVTCAVVGAKNAQQATANCGAAGWDLSAEQVRAMEAVGHGAAVREEEAGHP